MNQANKANKAMDAYQEKIGWGRREVTVDVEIDGQVVTRRLDIADQALKKGIEYKTGYQTLNEANKYEILRDTELVKDDWEIQWVFEGTASKQLLEKLSSNGIPYKIIGK